MKGNNPGHIESGGLWHDNDLILVQVLAPPMLCRIV